MKVVLLLCVFAVAAFANEEEGQHFQGDIVLTPDQMEAIEEQNSKNGNKFAAMKSKQWKTNGKTDVIDYYIESSLQGQSQKSARDGIKAAVEDYETYTCLRFKEKTTKPTGPHLSFFLGRGCYSYVGRQSSGQQISLGYGCWRKGTILHEMGHALGFFHEQSRPDRDNYVEILLDNVRSGFENNFNKYTTYHIDSMGSPYDYKSMMHYGSDYFKKSDGLLTIRTKDPKMQSVIGQRNRFSEQDIIQLNKMYCGGAQPSVSPSKAPVPQTKAPVLPTKQSTTQSPKTTEGVCVDTYHSCESWKIICGTNAYARKRCPVTCGVCNGPSTTAVPSTTAMPSTTTLVQTTQGACVDTSASCQSSWKNLCATNSYVRKRCPAKCGLCNGQSTTVAPTTPAKNCVDLSSSCDYFSNNGFCATSKYVKGRCQKTCGLC